MAARSSAAGNDILGIGRASTFLKKVLLLAPTRDLSRGDRG
jgi:hypothetical protein